MAFSLKLLAPAGTGQAIGYSGTVYTADVNGYIVVTNATDAAQFLSSGYIAFAPQPANFRNMIDGGDFTVNPFQRGTSQVADITNTVTYGPDRFAFKCGASGATNWSKTADTTIPGFSQSLTWQRKSGNADTTALTMVQALESTKSIRAQGQQITLSFYARTGANYSGGALTVQLEQGTGTDQSAANLILGSWTNQAHVINTTQALTAGMTRYSFTGTATAAATQLGMILQWTPTGTASTNDTIIISGIQLEIGSVASPFEHRDPEVELALCQRYFFQINEPAAGVVVAQGAVGATNTELVSVPLPVTMRAAPTVTVSAGSFKFNIIGIATAVAGFAAAATHTPYQFSHVGTTTATAGQSTSLVGGGGVGLVAASADL